MKKERIRYVAIVLIVIIVTAAMISCEDPIAKLNNQQSAMLGGLVLSHIEDILEKQNIDLINFDKPQSFTKLDMAEVDGNLDPGKVILVSGSIAKNQDTWKLIAKFKLKGLDDEGFPDGYVNMEIRITQQEDDDIIVLIVNGKNIKLDDPD